MTREMVSLGRESVTREIVSLESPSLEYGMRVIFIVCVTGTAVTKHCATWT